MHDLHQAMVRDESGRLKALLEDFMTETDETARKAILKELIFAWSGAENIAPNSRCNFINAQELVVLEQYSGRPFVGTSGPNPHVSAAPILKQAYEILVEHFYRHLLRQTFYAEYFNAVETFDISALISYVTANVFGENMTREESMTKVRDLMWLMEDPAIKLEDTHYQLQMLEAMIWFSGRAIENTELTDYLMSEVQRQGYILGLKEDKNYIQGNSGDNAINGTTANDLIYGMEGNDILKGGAGDDTLIGGKGDDYLEGEAGKNTYIWELGDGNDTINDFASYKNVYGQSGILKIRGEINPNDVEITRMGNNLILIT